MFARIIRDIIVNYGFNQTNILKVTGYAIIKKHDSMLTKIYQVVGDVYLGEEL